MYRIDELAKIANVSSRTLRHYDNIGLLVAKRNKDNGYRYYTSIEVDRLQDILFYKELGFNLNKIKTILNGEVNRITELSIQLEYLKNEKNRYELLIKNISNTINYLEGGRVMSVNEKFEGFKQDLIKENETKYKDEVIKSWGKEKYDKSVDFFKNMTEAEYDKFINLDKGIKENLLAAFKEGNDPESQKAQAAAKMHQEWIKMSWGFYNEEAHLNLVDMYLQDERFKEYYDHEQDGLALLLKNALYVLLLK